MSDIKHIKEMHLTQQEVQEIIDPYKDDLYGCVADGWLAWTQFGKEAPGLRLPLKKRARAAFVFDHIIASAVERFSKRPGVRYVESKGLFRLLFPQGVVIRFKKFDQYRRPSWSKTQQFRNYVLQLSLGLDGVRLTTNLITGYRLTGEEIELQDISITCPDGNHNSWYLEIPPKEIPGIQNISQHNNIRPVIRAKSRSQVKSKAE